MFKALDSRDNSEIVILDPRWTRVIDQLRGLDHQDVLVCQGCKQPVRVRAGGYRRPHFAHKHLLNCDYEEISPALREARAVLYEWLVSKFGDSVTIEKKLDGDDLFRPVDCWVTHGSGAFAYWVFDSTLKPEKREVLKGLRLERVTWNWIFSHEMLRPAQEPSEGLILSTTEREFIGRSKYNIPTAGHYGGGCLHYLDPDKRELTTYRNLWPPHPPQIYVGLCQTSELEQVLVSPENGEPVHPGEHEKLQLHRQQEEAAKSNPHLRWENFASQRPNHGPPPPDGPVPEGVRSEVSRKSKSASDAVPESYAGPFERQAGKCIHCGIVTTDWWHYIGQTGECECNSCKQKGLV